MGFDLLRTDFEALRYDKRMDQCGLNRRSGVAVRFAYRTGACFLAAFACQGCFDSSDSNPPAVIDAGLDSSAIDSAAPIDGSIADVAIEDVAIDSPPSRGNVTVQFLALGTSQPIANAYVVFVEPDATTTLLATGSDGRATRSVLTGSSVTAAALDDGSWRLVTIENVKPNDNIVLGIRPQSAFPARDVTIRFAPYQGDGGTAQSYRANAGCGDQFSAAANTDIPFPAIACGDSNGTLHVQVSALDVDSKVIGTLARDIPPTDAGAVAATFVGADWANTTPHTLTVHTVPGTTNPYGYVYYRKGGSGPFAVASGQSPITFGRFSAAPLECVNATSAILVLPDGGTSAVRGVGMLNCAALGTGNLDALASGTLPLIESLSATAGPDGRPTVSWTSTAPMTGIAALVHVFGRITTDSGSTNLRWEFVASATKTSVTPPDIHSVLPFLAPAAIWTRPSLTVFSSTNITTDAFRQSPDEYSEAITNGTNMNNTNAIQTPAVVQYSVWQPLR